MTKRIIAALLVLALVLTLFAGCKKKPADAATIETGEATQEIVVPKGKKVTIITAPKAEYPEDYLAAKGVEALYPDNITVVELKTDTHKLRAGDSENIEAARKAVKGGADAIIFARASLFSEEAIRAAQVEAKKTKKKVLTAAIEPEQNIESSSADLVVACDWEAAAKEIIKTAKDMGAEYFVYFSTEHRGANKLIVHQEEYFRAACNENGVKFVAETNCRDSMYDMDYAKKVIREQVNTLVSNKRINAKTVLFSTDSDVQTTLVECANERGMMYVSPSLPSCYSGVAEVTKTATPEKWYDCEAYCEAIKEACGDKATFALYGFGLIKTMVYASTFAVFDKLADEKAVLSERAALRLKDASGSDRFALGKYPENKDGKIVTCFVTGYFTKTK